MPASLSPSIVAACALAAVATLTACSSSSGGAGGGGTTTTTTTTTTTGGGARALRVYVAGESIERRNRFVAAPFTATGALNDRGGGEARNDTEEYGWAIPFAERLRLRDAGLSVEWVGADVWASADDFDYSGSFPSSTPGRTSAISGTDIASWLEQRQAELTSKTHCYDVAFVSRGGNDFGNDDDGDFSARLRGLIELVAAGSSCRAAPVVYVTGHMPDDARDGSLSDATYAATQVHRFVERTAATVAALKAAQPSLALHFVDLYTPFLENRATTAFPSEVWSSGGVPDYAKIARVGDTMHPRRLASIYAGELAADAADLAELRALR